MLLNDNDPSACAWLRELIREGLLPDGEVSEGPMQELSGLQGYRQVHLFAGIGGWPYALQLAGWPATRSVWTGSCPCQPFSSAGKGKGIEDERHLWPVFLRLIRECRPPTIFGEQVANPVGRHWLARVRTDLEEAGYAVGCADLCAAGLASPHIRRRLYWLGNLYDDRQSTFGQISDRPFSVESFGSPWEPCETVVCDDGRLRRHQPGVFPLAHGVPGRVGLLRGYGNAIVPQVAAHFIRCFLEAEAELRAVR